MAPRLLRQASACLALLLLFFFVSARTATARPPLREENRRIASAATRLLETGRPRADAAHRRILARLGRSGDKSAIPVLRAFADRHPALHADARAAIESIERGSRLRVVFASMEVKPFAGTGGLGNVMSELPRALARMGHRPIVILPRHAWIDRTKLVDTGIRAWLDEPGGPPEPFQVLMTVHEGVPVFFIENDRYFSANRAGIYGNGQTDYYDNPERYDFFGAAIPVALREIQRVLPEVLDAPPDIVQLNDAHTASAAVALKRDSHFAATRTVMAVHNLGRAYQGRFPGWRLSRLRFADRFWLGGPAELHGDVNFLKLGLVEADAVVTVSRNYLKEILTPHAGQDLDGVLRERRDQGRVFGNLNGIDPTAWDPASDRHLPAPYSLADRTGKRLAKRALQTKAGLLAEDDVPVVGMIARLDDQKGWDDAIDLVDRAARHGQHVRFVFAGDGDRGIQARLHALAARHPSLVGVLPYSVATEHLIYGGSDLFLMPSKFEPSGLPQMYAMRYLTIPIVRAVGGLEESVVEWDPRSGRGNGFKFLRDPGAAFDRALAWYAGGEGGRLPLQRNAARSDFAWETTSAAEQVAIYRRVLEMER